MLKSLDYLLMLGAIALTAICWGAYGPVLHKGQEAMGHSRFRPFLCVGVAYFVIAVVVPIIVLNIRGEEGDWSLRGILWSSGGGIAGAIGALGIILAFNFGGKPGFVMPLVFGCAPVVNAFLSLYWQKERGDISPWFLSGLILVAVGAFTVLFFAPKDKAARPPAHGATETVAAATEHGGAGH